MKAIVENWSDLADDMMQEGIPVSNVIAIIAHQFLIARGILTNALAEAGKIEAGTHVLDENEALAII